MSQIKITFAALPAMTLLGACTTTGNMEQNALIGAAGGAVAGAIIGNNTGDGDAETGALIGATVGAAGGAYTGYQKDQQLSEPMMRRPAAGQQMIYDSTIGRYYYTDPATGRTYWQNGQLRG